MPRLIATIPFDYAGRRLAVGDAFEAIDKDAVLLKAIGRAKDATAEEVAPVDTRDLQAEDATAAKPTAKPKRRYKRRDMRAEN